ncbi:zinc finger protein 16 [Phyllostomus discolor]|uniref:Zinc finger protein 16 n=1 Tax=Phyllostomus discolor TaxID=89673 RepID=A0A833ZZR0_9CHIR|nr:zinc finger protein 16 [Phyllostomus discolor]
MPSPRARPKEAEMDPSAPGPSPWTPAARVSDVPAVTRPASARCAPLCCGDADQGAAPQHHQQPVTYRDPRRPKQSQKKKVRGRALPHFSTNHRTAVTKAGRHRHQDRHTSGKELGAWNRPTHLWPADVQQGATATQ